MVISVNIDFWKLVKVALKGEGRKSGRFVGEVGGDSHVSWPLCVFMYISVVVVEGVLSGIACAGFVYSWYSRLVSGC
jgi:hypothetical protein